MPNGMWPMSEQGLISQLNKPDSKVKKPVAAGKNAAVTGFVAS